MAESSKGPSKEKAPGGEMSVREAGKKGGDTVRERYGSGFYETIGKKAAASSKTSTGRTFTKKSVTKAARRSSN
jgi:hypothetical protein